MIRPVGPGELKALQARFHPPSLSVLFNPEDADTVVAAMERLAPHEQAALTLIHSPIIQRGRVYAFRTPNAAETGTFPY